MFLATHDKLNTVTTDLFSQSKYGLLINNQLHYAHDGKMMYVKNPATGDILVEIPDGGETETSQAIDAAATALPAWSSTTASTRAILLHKVAELMVNRQEYLATVMTLEQGKPLAEARSEILYAASFLKWFAGEAERIYGQIIPSSATNKRILTLRQPVGIVSLITPWNFPSAMLTRKLGAALAAGCTVVCKPAEQTPLSALELGNLFIEAGFPEGVINIITMQDPLSFSNVVFSDKRVRKISFTGSVEVGKTLIRNSAEDIKRLSLELGGNAPFIVFDDADLDTAIDGAITSKFRNGGQTCVCPNRIFVHSSIYPYFIEKFVAKVKELTVGNGLDPITKIGPLIDNAALEKVKGHITEAVSLGANILVGGQQIHQGGLSKGNFWSPTVISHATPAMRVTQEETFGPVAPIIMFDKEEDVISMANDTQYGLAAYFYTRNINRAIHVAEALEYGIVGINDGLISTAQAPFGGIKESGLGREGGPTGVDEYLNTKYLSLAM